MQEGEPRMTDRRVFSPAIRPQDAWVVAAPADAVNAVAAPETWLPADICADIARYLQPQDRAARYAAWGLLLMLLARLTGMAPSAMAVVRSPAGRPSLAGGGPDFNISHTGGWVAAAVTPDGYVGVDIERERPCEIWDRIAPDFLHPDELVLWRRGAPATRAAEALRLWCLKEAILKAGGEGLPGDPRRMDAGTASRDGRLERSGRAYAIHAQPVAPGICLACALSPPAPMQMHVLDADAIRDLRG